MPGIAAALSAVSTGTGLIGGLMNIFPPIGIGYQRAAYKKDPNLIPTVGDLVEMRFKGVVSESEYNTLCAQNGYDITYADAYYEASRTLLNAYEYVTLWRRGTLSDNELEIGLSALRYDGVHQERLKRVTEYFPNPADLVRFAVREVYSPEIAERFGQFEDLPQVFIDEAYKAGLNEEYAKYFWGAHWDLPSVQQGFEMQHRRVIEKEELNLLLRALDVMPYWRDKLIQISYNPLTRVDVRRMFRLGVLDEEAVKNAYLDLGYNEENAELMTRFTKVYESDENVGITRANVVTAYKRGLIELSDLRDWFYRFGYDVNITQFWVDMAEYEKALEEIESDKNELIERYLKGQITVEQIREELNKKDVPSAYISAAVTTASERKAEKVKLASPTDLRDWLNLGILDEKEYNEYMLALGYRSKDVQRYLTEEALKRDTSKRKFLDIRSYQRWLKVGIMSVEEFIETAQLMRYSDVDITNLLMEVQEQLGES